MLATYRSYEASWAKFGAVCWHPTGLPGPMGQVWVCMSATYRPLLDWVWGCMSVIYRSYGACWTKFGAVCWATYRSHGGYWTNCGALSWQSFTDPQGLWALNIQLPSWHIWSPRTYGFQALGFEIASTALGRWLGLRLKLSAPRPWLWAGVKKYGWYMLKLCWYTVPIYLFYLSYLKMGQRMTKMARVGWFRMVYLVYY